MIYKVTKRLEWDAAHRVLRHESKCATLHGHRYAAEITCHAEQLDSVGRVVDFGVIKERVGKFIDEELDHTTIVHPDDVGLRAFCEEEERFGKRRAFVMPSAYPEPTAENLAALLLHRGAELLAGTGCTVVSVTVYETPTSRATVEP